MSPWVMSLKPQVERGPAVELQALLPTEVLYSLWPI